MTTAVREAPNHRKTTCYTDYKCRRPECVDRYNTLNRERLQAKKSGTWNIYVDAAPVRQHLLHLQNEGVTPCIVAFTTGLPKQTIMDFLYPNPARGRGIRQRTNPELAAKILSVTVESCLGGKVPAVGAARRIRALVAAGWPLNHITLHANLHRATAGRVLHRDTIYASTAKAIDDTYRLLGRKRPERNGVDKRQAKRARNWAEQEKWATVGYWAERMDVIDDPHFEPMYGVTRRLIVAQDANEIMRTTGVGKATAAERLGVSKAYVEHAFRDHPEYAIEAAA